MIDAGQDEHGTPKRIVIIAGPNGAGKTSLSSSPCLILTWHWRAWPPASPRAATQSRRAQSGDGSPRGAKTFTAFTSLWLMPGCYMTMRQCRRYCLTKE